MEHFGHIVFLVFGVFDDLLQDQYPCVERISLLNQSSNLAFKQLVLMVKLVEGVFDDLIIAFPLIYEVFYDAFVDFNCSL